MDTILVVNAGSSSVKFQVFETGGPSRLKRLIKGQVEGIGTRPRLRAQGADGTALIDQTYATDVISDVPGAIREAGAWLRTSQKLNLIAVGHRVVHGGPAYSRPTLIDSKVVEKLERYIPLAPLHQPNNLAPIRSILEGHLSCLKSRVSIRHFTEVIQRLRITMQSPSSSTRRVSAVTDSTDCRMNLLQSGCGSFFRIPRSPA